MLFAEEYLCFQLKDFIINKHYTGCGSQSNFVPLLAARINSSTEITSQFFSISSY